MAARAEDLLPVEYFHVVFTLPAEIAQIAYWNKKAVYGLLFRASAETVTTIAADPRHLGARVGMTSVLHTWGSALTHHPHVHMIVPGGGLSPDGNRWIACRPGFFLPVRVLSRLFRRLFLEGLAVLHKVGALQFFGDLKNLAQADAFAPCLAPLRKAEWVVYAKPPFGGPEAVLAYLSRYTHRVALSNHRLISADAAAVAFRWKDYGIKHGDRKKVMRLETGEFIRRFLIHVLPDGFHRIRALRAAGQRGSQGHHRPHPRIARRGAAGPGLAGECRGHPSHPARTVPLLWRRDAHRRDLPPRSEAVISSTTSGVRRMTQRPSQTRETHWLPPAGWTAPGMPVAPLCPEKCNQLFRRHPKPTPPAVRATSSNRHVLPGRWPDHTLAITRSTLSP